ncbi:MAG: glycoside-pentoside-hexuronide (GPH):cation symporter [Spirochaetales bacterium]|nr:glycoside-pentoside-hexuronide (GPH):cation symporter [Spirochaetales bacterium]
MEKNFITKSRERIGYYGYFFGQNIIYGFVTVLLSVYYATALGIPAAIVGSILLIARVWDAINDPMLSILVEKTNLKNGKFKPWIKCVAIIIPGITVLLFSFTNLLAGMSLAARISYATITYILWGMVYTISDAPAFALATVMTDVTEERTSIISHARIFSLAGILLALVGGPALLQYLGQNWFFTAVVLSGLSLVFLLFVNLTKERVDSRNESPSLKQILSAIFQNKYIIIMVFTLLFVNGFNFAQIIAPFLAADVFENASLTSVILGVLLLPTVICAAITPLLVPKIGKNAILKMSFIAIIVFSTITYFVGYNNFTIFIILQFIRGLFASFVLVVDALFFADCIEYDFYKKGKKFEAAVFSARTFTAKASAAVGGAGGMWMIAHFGFKESIAGQTVVQTQRAIDGIWFTYNIGPVLGAVIALVLFSLLYDINEKTLKKMASESKYSIKKTVDG